MPTSFPYSQPGTAALENSVLKCKTCGKSLTLPGGQASAELVEEESTRCRGLQEITQQRQALAVRMQGGIVGMLGGDTVDTTDMVAHRKSLAQLDATLKAEAEELAALMHHAPLQRN